MSCTYQARHTTILLEKHVTHKVHDKRSTPFETQGQLASCETMCLISKAPQSCFWIHFFLLGYFLCVPVNFLNIISICMATSSGNSSGSSALQIMNSGSDQEGLHQVMDQRKRKRMVSNRESARRSRMRKQEHLTDLTAQVGLLMKENNQILTSINVTNQLYLNLEAENCVLRAQMAELSNRLQSLNDILDYIDSSKWLLENEAEDLSAQFGGDGFLNPWSNLCFNQPVDMFMC